MSEVLSVEKPTQALIAHYAEIRKRLRNPPKPPEKPIVVQIPTRATVQRALTLDEEIKQLTAKLEELQRKRDARSFKPLAISCSARRITDVVADYFHLPFETLIGVRRSHHIAFPRQIAMYLIREMTPRSMPFIGKLFTDRDHTTVLHACRKIEALRLTDPELSALLDHLTEIVKSGSVASSVSTNGGCNGADGQSERA